MKASMLSKLKVFHLNPVRFGRFTSTSSFSRLNTDCSFSEGTYTDYRNGLTHSVKGHASSLAFCDHFSSSKEAFRKLPAFEPGFDRNKSANECQRTNMFIIFLRVFTLHSLANEVFKSTDLMST